MIVAGNLNFTADTPGDAALKNAGFQIILNMAAGDGPSLVSL